MVKEEPRGCREAAGSEAQKAGRRRERQRQPAKAPGRLLAAPRRACVIGARLPGLGPAASSSYSAGRLAAR